jgi:3-phenylpropionate/trans-cinnamate dioxygenase ferredoxin subunit
MGWIRVCDSNSLQDGDIISFNHDDDKMLLARINGNFYATDGICTHEDEKTVTCPLHLSAFNLESGAPCNAPAELPLKTYQTKVEEGGVYVQVQSI